uniref:Reverse transcriptase domain-containing protein n=1 Tax=Leptobrachium leishanense TaxID=445787 RepID=A0A8C5PB27_9ANUR
MLCGAAPSLVCTVNKDTNLIIKPADKGGGLVILNQEQYHLESCRLLNDVKTYLKLGNDPTEQIKQMFLEYLQRGKDSGILNEQEYQYLKINYPRIPVFYHLPKIHKNCQHPPGRPIVSGIDSISCRVSEHIDHLLQPLVQTTPAYLKDTISVLKLLKEIKWEPNFIFATCDVNSLYTIIPHEAGCKATEFFLLESKVFKLDQIQYIIEGINLILKNNYFWYGGDFYLQINGTAMGTRFAPSYANLFMAHWESSVVWTGHDWGPNLVLYRRYIDDVLIIWQGERQELESFISHLNNNELGIKLDSNISPTQVNFLDLTIYVEDSEIKTRTFFKAVQTNNYIPTNSGHYPPWLKAIPKGQLLRIRRNCTDVEQYLHQAEKLIDQFEEKGYNNVFLDEMKKEVLKSSRDSLLQYKHREDEEYKEIPFIMDYNINNKLIKKSIEKYWPVLTNDPILNSILPEKPKIIFRGGNNLSSDLVHSYIRTNDVQGPERFFGITPGFYGCG